jgi:trk system potassium uptake protein
MHKRTVMYGVARLLQVMALALLAPLCLAVFDNIDMNAVALISTPEVAGFILAIVMSFCTGAGAVFLLRSSRQIQTVREGFAIVGIGWMALALFGAVPMFVFLLSQHPSMDVSAIMLILTDSVFEIMSGFTTTGATILQDIEAMPRSLLLWRALTQWLGGMGIVTLALVIFPAMGVSGYHMFKGEVPGPTKARIQTRLARTATVLWGVYALFTVAEALLLLLGGMDVFDAVCHSFATMATGGFSTKNASIAHYSSEYVRWVITIFMFLAGVNFLLHYNALRGNPRLFGTDREFRFYAGIIVSAVLLSTAVLYLSGLPAAETSRHSFRSDAPTDAEFVLHIEEQRHRVSTVYDSFRESAFHVVSIATTTGFCTADFDVWPSVLRILLVVLMFMGGCAGSTGGGMKVIRVMIALKAGWREIIRLARPRIVRPIKVGDDAIEEDRVGNIIAFMVLFLVLTGIATLLLSFFVPDIVTAVTAVIACIANIGPGLAGVGAVETYAWIPMPGKWILIFVMLLGRLEIFTILVLLRPSVWK